MNRSYIAVNGWNAHIRFSSAHIIPEYEKCGRLHGHTYAIQCKIFGKPDEKGIIADFSVIKQILRKIANTLDHKILIPSESTVVTITQENSDITVHSLGKKYVFPLSDCVLLPIPSTSAENLSLYILNTFIDQLKPEKNITSIEIGVDEGYGQGARVQKDIKQ
ncbi:MAG: 6-carboxytetrahydropterin synthase [Thermoplasmatota archaeon]